MSDAYEHLRKHPLNVVLAALGFESFKLQEGRNRRLWRLPNSREQEEHDLLFVRR